MNSILKLLQREECYVELLMLQGIVLSPKNTEKILQTSGEIMHSGADFPFRFHFAIDGSQTHVFLSGHHTGISIPLKYSSSTFVDL